MLSAVNDEQHDPHGMPEISPEVVLVARAAADFPSLAPDARGHHAHAGTPGADVPKVDTTFRASDTSGERLAHGKWLRSAAMAFLFALCSALAAAGWQRYGDEARAVFSDFTPQATLSSLLPNSLLPSSLIPGRAAVAAPPDAPAPPPATADQAAPSAPAAQQTADSAGPAPAPSALPPETEQLLQSMARDVASLNQQVGELKERITELKAGQAQLSHEMTKMSEARVSEARVSEPRVSEARPAEPRPAKLGAPPRPLGTLVTHRPKPPSYPQAAYVPPPPPRAAPVQIAPPPATLARPYPDAVVVRPPMPVQ